MHLGVCYYPEHWPEAQWADDAARMAAMGLSRVRIGEFAWSRIEPEPGRFDWGWLDRAVAVLHGAGLGIIMGTPTATPPKWLVDQMPDMIAVDADGRPRNFGSRRHYCFSHLGYRAESARITRAMVDRYGQHPAIVAWQTDNEYGCHDTAVSYSLSAAAGFRDWCRGQYGDIGALNAAWGNVFWSMEYRDFAEIDLPLTPVTEPNPAHVLAFRRYSSDQVVAFNKVQVDIVRALSPGRDVMHNFMGFFTQFDHHAVGRDIDVAGWDSYPLGFLEQFWFSEAEKAAYLRQGHPDIAAFHHDLYRGTTAGGRWCVLEQQPGPVNWARFNPAPLPGMVRLWTLEAMAHGAELTSYFRWRQAPFAQEQMHAGLLRPDSVEAPAADEVRAAAADIAAIGALTTTQAPVALIFDYTSAWVTDAQPQGRGFSALRIAFDYYSALRRHGIDVDIIAPSAPLDGYRMVVVPCLPIVPDGLADRLSAFPGPILIGARSGSKTADFAIPETLPPGPLKSLLPLTITRVESLRDGVAEAGDGFALSRWFEHVETALPAEDRLTDGRGVVFAHAQRRYVATWPEPALLDRVVTRLAAEAAIAVVVLPQGIRLRRAGQVNFAFNYSSKSVALPAPAGTQFVIGSAALDAAGLAVWVDGS
jgi:beta-galactosidase